ncbi:ribosomal RNA-processing protein 7-domain-containing protein [Phycomyces nitens]|nr:ribosomal RNA-processing protein 7-domain-containing protein [Phycomyces nitens]
MPKEVKTKKAVKATKPKALDTFFGFTILPVLVAENCRHYMYMKKHESRTATELLPKDRSLFVLNLPVDTTDDHLRQIFSDAGIIKRIIYHDGVAADAAYDSDCSDEEEFGAEQAPVEKKTSKKSKKRKNEEKEEAPMELRRVLHTGSSAHIVFAHSKMLETAFNTARDRVWTAGEKANVQSLGFERYMLRFAVSRPDPAMLQRKVDSFMMKFKANEYEKERLALERMNQMDDDGFVVVTRNKKVKTSDGNTSVSTFKGESFDASKVKKKELENFYRFQLREKKQNELVELRKKFEEDKEKIALLKQSRKFKPF